MLKKIIFTVSFILISLFGIAQKDINNYKYIIVPKEYDFSKGEDQYQLNSITKFLFNKYDFEAYFVDDDLPEDLKTNRCLALTSEVSNVKGGMFKTKLEIVLKDCYGAVVMTSQIGESRLKQFDRAYNQALRHAFETFQNFDYKYVPKEKAVAVSETPSKVEKPKDQVIEKPSATIGIIAVREKESEEKEVSLKQNSESIYYAQAIENGFQLVNSEPKIVMVLLNTAAENVFIVKDKSAIVFKEDGFWYYSENNGKLVEKKSLNIKF